MMRKLLTVLAISLLASTALADGNMARPFTGKDAADAIGRDLTQQGAGEIIRVVINGVREDDQIASAPSLIIATTEGLHIDKAHSRWDTTLIMVSDGKNLAPVKLSGHWDEMMHVPELKTRMQSGDIIKEEDITWDDVPASRQRKSIIIDAKDLIGKSPRHIVSAGRPVRTEEVGGATVIAKGAQVTLVYKTPNIEIKTLGEAMENGALGTVIKVKNVSSKSIIQGIVESDNVVRIGSPDSVSAGL
jgi:flagella basal body P-ring formation protein FlgA